MDRPGVNGFAPGAVIGRRYEIERLLQAEPHGPVYLARDQVLDIKVALKILPQETADFEKMLEYYRQEAVLGLKLHHPQILGVQYLDETPEGIFLVQEACQGNPLSELLQHSDILTQDDALYLLEVLAQGLAFAHKHGICHQHLYPGNILVSTTEGIKIKNFTFPPDLAGSRRHPELGAYLPPEIWEGQPMTPAGNIFSLGVIGFQMLTGRFPFPWREALPVPYDVAEESQNFMELPVVWQALLNRCLAPAPEQRFPAVPELLAELQALRLARRPAPESPGQAGRAEVGSQAGGSEVELEVAIDSPWQDRRRLTSHGWLRNWLVRGQEYLQQAKAYLGPEPISRNRRKQAAAGVGGLLALILGVSLLSNLFSASQSTSDLKLAAREGRGPGLIQAAPEDKGAEPVLPKPSERPASALNLPAPTDRAAAGPLATPPTTVGLAPAAPLAPVAPPPAAPSSPRGREVQPRVRPAPAAVKKPALRLAGTYTKEGEARKQVARLQKQGQRAMLRRVVRNQKPYYQVLVVAAAPTQTAGPVAGPRTSGRPGNIQRR